VLLTRAPLYRGLLPFSFDLHVLSAPLTFVLSQDQTLQLNLEGSRPSAVAGRGPWLSFVFGVVCHSGRSPMTQGPTNHEVTYNPVFKDRGKRLSPRVGRSDLSRPPCARKGGGGWLL
jgi:hypothetical protein